MEEKEPSMPTLDEFNSKVFESGDTGDLNDGGKSVAKLTPPTIKKPGAARKKDEEIKSVTGIKLELTAKQKEEIKDAFVACDVSGNGYMSTRDLKIALRALGFEPRKNEIKKIIEKVDKNNSGKKETEKSSQNSVPFTSFLTYTGKLCFADFMEVITLKLAEKDSRDEILKAFKLFDKDQTGFITVENLRQIAAELGEGLNDEEVKEMIDEADMDNDGAVNQDEFFRIMKKTSLY